MLTEIKNKRKAGFTIIELMVVIIIVNVLSGVVVPKLTDYIEITKERVDMLKLYYLRDALNRALYEDDAYRLDASKKCGQQQNNADSLESWLASEAGVTLFIIELHNSMSVNYQGENKRRTKDEQNMCGLLASESFWLDAFRSAGFGAVADIVKARANGDNFDANPGDYYVEKDPTTSWNRTYPKTPIFRSYALTNDIGVCSNVNNDCGQTRYSMKARWTGGNEKSHSLEIFLAKNNSSTPFKTKYGVCFATQGCN